MADPIVPNYINGVGRLAVDRFTYEKHIEGLGDRHTASQIDLFPTVVIGSTQSNVQAAISAIAAVINTPPPDATTTIKGILKLAGDLAGTATNVIVAKIQGKPISNLVPNSGDVLTWNGSIWLPQALTGTFNNLTVSGNTILGTDNSNTLTVNAQAIYNNNLTVNGNTVLGNAGTDTITINGSSVLNKGIAVSGGFVNIVGGPNATYSSMGNTNLTSAAVINVIATTNLNINATTCNFNAATTLLTGFVSQNSGTLNIGAGSQFTISPNATTVIQSSLILSGIAKINKKYANGGDANANIYPGLVDVYQAPTLTSGRQWTINETIFPAAVQGFELEIINNNPFFGIDILSPSSTLITTVGSKKAAVFYRNSTTWVLKYMFTIN